MSAISDLALFLSSALISMKYTIFYFYKIELNDKQIKLRSGITWSEK
jgi:hypothetical protein